MTFFEKGLVAGILAATIGVGVVTLLGGCANGTITPTAAALGQEYCSVASATGPLTVALLDTNGVPVTVTNKLSTDVAAACALWNVAAVPVSPPTTPVPAVAVKVPTS